MQLKITAFLSIHAALLCSLTILFLNSRWAYYPNSKSCFWLSLWRKINDSFGPSLVNSDEKNKARNTQSCCMLCYVSFYALNAGLFILKGGWRHPQAEKLFLQFPWIFNVEKRSVLEIPSLADNLMSQQLFEFPFTRMWHIVTFQYPFSQEVLSVYKWYVTCILHLWFSNWILVKGY